MRRPPLPAEDQTRFVPVARAGPYAAMIDPRTEDESELPLG